MKLTKSKISIFSILGIVVITALVLSFSSPLAADFTKDIFPNNLNGIPLIGVEEDEPDEDIAKGFTAEYLTDDESKGIIVIFWRMTSPETAQIFSEEVVDGLKYEYSGIVDEQSWEDSQTVTVKGNDAILTNYRICIWDECMDAGIISTAIDDYLIVTQISDYEGYKPSSSDVKALLSFFIDKVPGGDNGNGGNGGPGPQEPTCGNNNCEYWVGEDCRNCRQDCKLDGYCCMTGYSFIYNHDYHQDKYKIHEAPGGNIPNYAFVVPKGTDEDDMPWPPSICHYDRMVTGECIRNWECPSGVCTVENWCIKAVSETFEFIEEEVAEKIDEDETAHKKEYVDAYYKVEESINTYMRVRQEKLDVKLEVQGNTAGKVPEVNKGDPVEVRLNIKNGSDYTIAVAPAILYPGAEMGGFQIDEEKYYMTFKWSGGVSSLIGSFLTKLSGSVIMPPGSELLVYSKVVPQQTGYLDIQGTIFYSVGKKYKKSGFDNQELKDYQESEVSESVLVNEPPCGWWPICL